MKSMCQDARRNSPSVAEREPTALCFATTSRIASSSMPRSASSIRPIAWSSRARRRRCGRSRLRRGRRETAFGLVWHRVSFLELVERGAPSPCRRTSKRNRPRLAPRLRRVVGAVAVEVHARDDGLQQPASEESSSGVLLRDEGSAKRPSVSVGRRPNPCAGSRARAARRRSARRRRRAPVRRAGPCPAARVAPRPRARVRGTARRSATASSRLDRGLPEHDVPAVGERPLGLGGLEVEAGDEQLARPGSRTELKMGSYAKSRSPGKYICVTSRCVNARPKTEKWMCAGRHAFGWFPHG